MAGVRTLHAVASAGAVATGLATGVLVALRARLVGAATAAASFTG
jgi:hypothetical protein